VDDLWRRRDLLGDGLTHARLYGAVTAGRLHRVGRGIYGPIPPERLDRLRALFRRLPPGAVLGFHSAARAHGFGVLRSCGIHVIVPAGISRPCISGVTVHEAVVPVHDVRLVGGVPCAPPARCAVDLARSVPRLDALPVLDAALRAGACVPDDLFIEVGRHDGLRGVRQVRELVPLAHPGAECPQESQLRLVLIDGGLPQPEPQLWVCDSYGIRLYRLDLGYEAPKVGIEYDGRSHLDRARMRADRVRSNWLASRGWRMRVFTDQDLYRTPRRTVATVRAALG
jgi:hypothetical protein